MSSFVYVDISDFISWMWDSVGIIFHEVYALLDGIIIIYGVSLFDFMITLLIITTIIPIIFSIERERRVSVDRADKNKHKSLSKNKQQESKNV